MRLKGRKAVNRPYIRALLKHGPAINVILKEKARFEEETGIRLEVEVYDEPTLRRRFQDEMESRSGYYDVITVQFWFVPEYGKRGWLQPLEQFLERGHVDLTAFPAAAVEALKYHGEQIAIPQTFIGGMLIYRRDLFEKHGLPAPETTEDVLALADRLQDLEGALPAWVTRAAPVFPSFGTYAGWAWGYGCRLVQEGRLVVGPALTRAMSDLAHLVAVHGPGNPTEITWERLADVYQQGVGMMFDTSAWGSILEADGSPVRGRNGYRVVRGPSGNPLQWLYVEGLGLNPFSPRQEEAWTFLAWRSSLDTALREWALGRWDVPNFKVLQSKEYQEAARRAGMTEYALALREAWDVADAGYWPATEYFERLGLAFTAAMASAIRGERDVESALESVARELRG